MTDPDYAALAAQAEKDHRAANERFQEAKTASEMSSFRQVVFACMAAGVTVLNLEASDQGDHMSLSNVLPEELHDSDLDNELWDGISDLGDYTSSDWAGQAGVTTTISHRDDQIMSATVDIPVAAEALIAATPETPTTSDVVLGNDMTGKTVASVTEEDEVMRDTFKDDVTVHRTVIKFTDGSWTSFGEVQMDLYRI